MIINLVDGKTNPQISWVSIIKSWAAILLTSLSSVTFLVVMVVGIRVMVWRVRGDGSPLLRSSATQSPNPTPTVSLVPSSSPLITEQPAITVHSPSPFVPADTTSSPRPSVSSPAAPTTVPSLSFKLVIPVSGVHPEQLRDTYSDARSEGRVHNAIDIMAARGAPVVAAADGRILKLFASDRGGRTIYQMGPDQKTILYYAHLDRYADGLVEGKSVQQGEIVGYVGDTGNAGTGNYHLHFAIWLITDPKYYWHGENINPYTFLR